MAKKKVAPHSETKRNKDLVSIRDLLSVFPRPLVDRVLEEALADRILTDHIDCLTEAEGIFHSTLFHLYNNTLWQLLDDLFRNWSNAWDVGRTTHHDHLHRGVATITLSDFDPPESWKEHETYVDHVQQAHSAMSGLTKHLHEEYPDLDLAESDQEASRKYWEMEERVERHMKEIFERAGAQTEQDGEEPVASDEGGDEDASRDATRDYLIKVADLKGMLNERARNGSPSEQDYARLRNELIAIPPIRDKLPTFVLKHRTIEEFWQFIKPKYKTWRDRTEFLQQEFEPLLTWLEDSTTPAKSNPTERASEMITVLLLSANPTDSPLNTDEEFRAIDQKIRSSEHRDHVELIKHGAVRLEDVAGLLMRHMPHVVHFSGHGDADGIVLTGPDGKCRLVPPDALANIFRTLKDNVRVVLLNACDSAHQAEAIVSEIDCAVGMSDEIDDDAAIAFAAAFYEALAYGRSVHAAFNLALVLLEGAGEDRSVAKLYNRRGVKLEDIILVPPRPQ